MDGSVTERAPVDIYDPGVYERGVPFEDFRRLRTEAPVYFHAEPSGTGYWAITKHKDIIGISRDPGSFSSYRRGSVLEDYEEGSDHLEAMRFMLVNMDPPQHVKFRNLVKSGFTPRMVQHMEPRIRAMVTRIIDDVIERGECEFMHDVSCKLPLEVIADMIGIPKEDRDMVIDWSDRMVASYGPREDPEIMKLQEDGAACGMQMMAYASELAETRAGGEAREDLISILMNASVDGERLTPMEFACFFMLLFVAGNETTRNATAQGMMTLAQHPEARQRIYENPDLLPSAVEEILRFASPIIYFRRTATRDVQLRGQTIREGDKVAMYYVSANRDEEVFADPDRFDITRTPNDHLAFGIGQHVCLGASLARLELRLIFEQLVARMPDIAVAGDVRRLRSNFINGFAHIPVRFTPGKRLAV